MGDARKPAIWPTRNDGLDALRTLAAAAVVVSHATADAGVSIPLLPTGTMGVGVFFVLSGYLIAAQLTRRPDDVGGYLVRRLVRILPAYWLATIALGALDPVFRADPFGWLTMTHPISGAFMDVSWSLRVEIVFYLVAPLLILMPTRWWLVLAAASFFAAWNGDVRGFIGSAWRFLPGMLVARYPGRTLPVAAALPFLAVPAIAGDAAQGGMALDPWTALGGGILVAAAVHRPLRIRGAAIGAALSYPMYLWHAGLLRLLTLPLALIGTVAVSGLSYLTLEAPMNRRAAAITRKARVQAAPDAADSPSGRVMFAEPGPVGS